MKIGKAADKNLGLSHNWSEGDRLVAIDTTLVSLMYWRSRVSEKWTPW